MTKIATFLFLLSTLISTYSLGFRAAPPPPMGIIGGVEVDETNYSEVVRVRTKAGFLTGVLIGPRVVLTAAHGIKNSPMVEFEYLGRVYEAMGFASPIYPNTDHDIAVAVSFDDIIFAAPVPVSTEPVGIGRSVSLFGFGCTNVSGAEIGPLRSGTALVNSRNGLDWTSIGSALCWGDSGGPAYEKVLRGEREVIGIGSKSNVKDTSYFVRLDSEETRKFFDEVIASFEVEICGINRRCGPSR